jgi:hypothetical protein
MVEPGADAGHAPGGDTVTSPDPVAEPNAYQAMLLGLVGYDDPAAIQSGTPAAWRALVADAGSHLRVRPAPDEWSVVELLGHAVDSELVSSARYRWILAHDTPAIAAYDQDMWVDRLRHGDADPPEQLQLFEALRAANLSLWRRTPVEDRSRFGIHAERGPESYELTFRLIAGHDRFHLDQARRTLAQVRASG